MDIAPRDMQVIQGLPGWWFFKKIFYESLCNNNAQDDAIDTG